MLSPGNIGTQISQLPVLLLKSERFSDQTLVILAYFLVKLQTVGVMRLGRTPLTFLISLCTHKLFLQTRNLLSIFFLVFFEQLHFTIAGSHESIRGVRRIFTIPIEHETAQCVLLLLLFNNVLGTIVGYDWLSSASFMIYFADNLVDHAVESRRVVVFSIVLTQDGGKSLLYCIHLLLFIEGVFK